MGDNIVLIGPNAWPIIESAIIIGIMVWMLERWSKKLPMVPLWIAFWKRESVTTRAPAIHRYGYPPQAQEQATSETPVEENALTMSQWLDRVNNQPDRVPHLAASGPSGSGKTTLILAALHQRPGRFVIVTPKSKRADPWGGLPVIRLRTEDMGFAPIGSAIEAVYAEMLRRNAENADVEDDWLTLVIDEFSTVIGKLPELKEKVLDLVTLGRSSRIRVIILATETNVKAWGWEGRGEARHNVLFIECEEETHRAVMFRWGKIHEHMDTRWVPRMANHPLPMSRWWNPVLSISRDTPEADVLLRAALSSAVECTFQGKHGDAVSIQPNSSIQKAEPLNSLNSAYESPSSENSEFMNWIQNPELPVIAHRMKAELNLGKNKIIEILFGVKPGGTKMYRDASVWYDKAFSDENA
jgi:energy-coupling factor transporter ATP-binding protein EcfA2